MHAGLGAVDRVGSLPSEAAARSGAERGAAEAGEADASSPSRSRRSGRCRPRGRVDERRPVRPGTTPVAWPPAVRARSRRRRGRCSARLSTAAPPSRPAPCTRSSAPATRRARRCRCRCARPSRSRSPDGDRGALLEPGRGRSTAASASGCEVARDGQRASLAGACSRACAVQRTRDPRAPGRVADDHAAQPREVVGRTASCRAPATRSSRERLGAAVAVLVDVVAADLERSGADRRVRRRCSRRAPGSRRRRGRGCGCRGRRSPRRCRSRGCRARRGRSRHAVVAVDRRANASTSASVPRSHSARMSMKSLSTPVVVGAARDALGDAVARLDDVLAGLAEERVVAAGAVERVVAGPAREHVVAGAAGQAVVPGAAGDQHRVRHVVGRQLVVTAREVDRDAGGDRSRSRPRCLRPSRGRWPGRARHRRG